MNPEKVTNITAVGVCNTPTPIFLLEDLQCPSTLDAAHHPEGRRTGTSTTLEISDSNLYQVQLTALQKQGSFSL